MNKRYLAAVILATTILFFQETNDGCIMSYAPFMIARLGDCSAPPAGIGASISPLAIFVYLTLFVWIHWQLQSRHKIIPESTVGFLARAGAGLVDLCLLSFATVVTTTLVVAILESFHLGEITLSFHRDGITGPDHFASLTALIAAFAYIRLLVYMPIVNQTATIGQFLFGYRVIKPETEWKRTRTLGNMISAGYCMAMWPITWYRAVRRGDGIMWWEETSGFRARRIDFS